MPRVYPLPLPGGGPPFVCYALPPERFGRVALGDWWCGFGSGFTVKESRRKAVAEIVERASAVFQGDEPRRRATLRSLGDDAVAPGTFLLFSRRQRRLQARYRSRMLRVPPLLPADQPIDWSPMRSLTHGCWKQVPTSAVYFKVPASPASRYCPADSNGLAAGASFVEASLRGLLELIERDSVGLWWYQRVERPRLAVGNDARVQRLLAGYERDGRTTDLLDLTSDLGIPVCAAVSRRIGDGGDVAFGFGAGLTRVVAARRALLELGQPLAVRAAGWAPGEGTGLFERWRRVQRDPLPAWLQARARRGAKRASPRAAPLPAPP